LSGPLVVLLAVPVDERLLVHREVFAEGPEDRPVGLLVEVSLPAVAGGLVEPDGDRMPVLVGLRDDHRPASADSDRTPISAVGVPLTGQVSGAVRNRASSTHGGSPPTAGQSGRNRPVTQPGSGCHGLSTLQPGKERASSGCRGGGEEGASTLPVRRRSRGEAHLV